MEPAIVKGRVEESAPVVETVNSDPAIVETHHSSKDELFATYDMDHSAPYLAELFGIKGLWNNPDLTYKTEINQLNEYLMGEIRGKTLDNSTTAVKSRIAALERQASISKTAPVELRVKLLAEHAHYLSKLESIKLGVRFDGITQ